MESQREGVKEIAPLLVQGGKVGTDRAKGIGAVSGPEAAGDLLFDLRHANRLLGKVVGERDAGVRSEAPDIIGIGAQAPEEVGRLALSCSSALPRFFRLRIEDLAFAENFGISVTPQRNAFDG